MFEITKKTKKRWIIISALLAGLMMLIGLFVALGGEKKKHDVVNVAAASSTDASKLSFEEGSQWKLSYNEVDAKIMRFTLNIGATINGGDYTLAISFGDESVADWGASKLYQKGNRITSLSEEIGTEESGVYYIDLETEGAPSTLTVFTESVSPYTTISLTARLFSGDDCNDESKVVCTATSDARSIYNVWEDIVDNPDDYGGLLTAERVPWIFNAVEDYRAAYGTATMSASVDTTYGISSVSAEQGMTKLITLSQDNIDLLKTGRKGEIEMYDNYGGYHIYRNEEYYLVVTRTTNIAHYEGTVALPTAEEGEEVHHMVYSLHKDNRNIPSAEYVTDWFENTTAQEIVFPAPAEGKNEVEYYYYVTVIKSIRYKEYWWGIFGAQNTRYDIDETDPRIDYNLSGDAPASGETIVKTLADYDGPISLKSWAEGLLAEAGVSNVSENRLKFLQQCAGTYTGETDLTTITVHYKQLATYQNGDWVNGYTEIKDSSFEFDVNSLWKQSPQYVLSQLGGKVIEDIPNGSGLSRFDVVETRGYIEESLTGDPFFAYTSNRTIRQANGYEYVYDEETDTGTLTILYAPFTYSDFFITIQSNGDEVKTQLPYYTAYNYANESNSDVITITFKYEYIETHVLNSLGWRFELDDVDETTGEKTQHFFGYEDLTLPKSFEITEGAEAFTVTYDQTNEEHVNFLSTLNITAEAEIEPDTLVESFTLKYKTVTCENGELIELGDDEYETITWTPTEEVWYSKIVALQPAQLWDEIAGWEVDGYGQLNAFIWQSVVFDGLRLNANGEGYYNPQGVFKTLNKNDVADGETPTGACELTISYYYLPMFKVSVNEVFKYYQVLNGNATLYYGNEVFPKTDLPVGHWVSGITSNTATVKTGTTAEGEDKSDDYTKTLISVSSTNGSEIYDVNVTITDVFVFEITYKETSVSTVTEQKTPFAVERTGEWELTYADYESEITSREISSEKLAKIIGVDELTVGITKAGYGLGMADLTQKIEFNGVSTYSVDVKYGVGSVRNPSFTDYPSGAEIQVPLMNYGEWCESFGANWTLLYLNGSKIQYFKYANDQGLEPKDVYGYFSMVVFKEKVSNVQDWFSNVSSDGISMLFSQKAVEGSALYKGCESLGLLGGLVSPIYMALEEWIGPNTTGTYYTHFFYIDGSAKNGYAYASNYGADNAFDNDTGFENTLQDIGGGISGFFKGIGNWLGDFFGNWKIIGKILSVVLFVALGIVIIAFIIWLLRKVGILPAKKASPKTSSPRKKTTSKSKSKKGKKK